MCRTTAEPDNLNHSQQYTMAAYHSRQQLESMNIEEYNTYVEELRTKEYPMLQGMHVPNY